MLGFVKLETVEEAQTCMEKLNKSEFRGSKLELFKVTSHSSLLLKSNITHFINRNGLKVLSPRLKKLVSEAREYLLVQ